MNRILYDTDCSVMRYNTTLSGNILATNCNVGSLTNSVAKSQFKNLVMDKMNKSNSIALAIAFSLFTFGASTSLNAQRNESDIVSPSDREGTSISAVPVKHVSFNESVKQKVAEPKTATPATQSTQAVLKTTTATPAAVKPHQNIKLTDEKFATAKAKRDAANKTGETEKLTAPHEKFSKTSTNNNSLSVGSITSPVSNVTKVETKRATPTKPIDNTPAPMIKNTGNEALPYENYKGIKNLDEAKMEWAKDNGLQIAKPTVAPVQPAKVYSDVNAHRRLPKVYDDSKTNIQSK